MSTWEILQSLTEFLVWGVENYASEYMGLVLWDHGGGSVTGVCFDEREDYDSLSLAELDEALYTYYEQSGRRFDFIGFDACLMGTVETANILATYADYMYASEETEPGSGWDYTAIGNFLASNPGADALALGKVVCDSFLEACRAQNDDNLTTLSVVDLKKVDTLLKDFNSFAMGMYQESSDEAVRAEMLRAIEQADNFGGNNKSEGYTNMVDMGGIIAACADYVEDAAAALQTLEETVAYSVSGQAHKSASGLSIYYPLSVQGSAELSVWSGVCVSPYYLSFVDRKNKAVFRERAVPTIPMMMTSGLMMTEAGSGAGCLGMMTIGIIWTITSRREKALILPLRLSHSWTRTVFSGLNWMMRAITMRQTYMR